MLLRWPCGKLHKKGLSLCPGRKNKTLLQCSSTHHYCNFTYFKSEFLISLPSGQWYQLMVWFSGADRLAAMSWEEMLAMG